MRKGSSEGWRVEAIQNCLRDELLDRQGEDANASTAARPGSGDTGVRGASMVRACSELCSADLASQERAQEISPSRPIRAPGGIREQRAKPLRFLVCDDGLPDSWADDALFESAVTSEPRMDDDVL